MDRVFDSSTGDESLDDEPSHPSVDDDAKDLGKTVGGKYVLRRLIGKGGMGAVFEAEHVELGKRVAIKILRAVHASRGGETASRFRREARAASAVDSEHIVDVFDVGEDPDLGLFMVMELLDGEDLGALLHRVGRLEPTLALAIARQAVLALDKAHAAGVVHRDLKPENVFLRARDLTVTVKLVDFGVAKLLRDVRERSSAGVTRAGSVLGTPSYMSPEQAMGLPEVDHRTDLYSLGALLYEMLVGEPAFPHKATYEMTIVSIVTGEPPRVADKVDVPVELDKLVTLLMSREPDARPGSARDVAELIDEVEPRAAARRLSRPALETLAIIAYRQPISKSEIEAIRGVVVDHIVKALMELHLIRIVGRSDLPGRPFLYGTTSTFLDHFGLKNLNELNEMDPTLQRSKTSERKAIHKKEKKKEEPAADVGPLFEQDAEKGPVAAPVSSEAVNEILGEGVSAENAEPLYEERTKESE